MSLGIGVTIFIGAIIGYASLELLESHFYNKYNKEN